MLMMGEVFTSRALRDGDVAGKFVARPELLLSFLKERRLSSQHRPFGPTPFPGGDGHNEGEPKLRGARDQPGAARR